MPVIVIALIIVLVSASTIAAYNVGIAWAMRRFLAEMPRDPETGIMKGAEPVFLNGTNGRACLLIHGFIGSPTDFGGLPRTLHAAGYTVFAPLLPGHGTDPRDFSKTTPDEMIAAVETAYLSLKKNHRSVTLVGFSLGGALGILTAERRPRDVDALVLLAPYLRIRHFWFYVLPTEWHHAIFSPFISYVYRLPCFKQVFRREAAAEMKDYSFVSMKGTAASFEIQKRAVRAVRSLRLPILVVHSTKDRATDYAASVELCRTVPSGNARLVTVDNSNHILLCDHDAPIVERAIFDFLKTTVERSVGR